MVSITKHNTYILFILAFNISILNIKAQVTIELAEPHIQGVLPQLKNITAIDDGANSTKGLGLPRIELKNIPKLQLGDSDEEREKRIGLLVCNTKRIKEQDNKIHPGLHVWTGEQRDLLTPSVGDSGTPTVIDIQKTILSKELHTDTVNYPIGALGKFTDTRGKSGEEVNEYYYARFYAAKVKEKVTTIYQDNTRTWTETEEIERIEDGVWMTENLRTRFAPNAECTPFPYLHDIESAYKSTYWSYPGEDSNAPEVEGLLYNWSAATVTENGVYGRGGEPGKGLIDQPTCRHEKDIFVNPIQGICPKGWHLPSTPDWNLLRSAILANPSLYCTDSNLTFETIAKAFKHPDTWYPEAEPEHAGTSKPADQGGFAALLTAFWDGDPTYYHTEAYFWTTSNHFSGIGKCSAAYYFMLLGWASDTGNGATFRTAPYAIRCMKY